MKTYKLIRHKYTYKFDIEKNYEGTLRELTEQLRKERYIYQDADIRSIKGLVKVLNMVADDYNRRLPYSMYEWELL